MKQAVRAITLFCTLFCLTSITDTFGQYKSPSRAQKEVVDDDIRPIKLNTKNFEKHLETYSEELGLTNKQIKKLTRIENKYIRKEQRLARKSTTKKKHLRALQEEKRERMIAVLDYDQQKKLESLTKKKGKAFWDFLKR